MKKILALICILTITGCSSLSQNFIKTGKLQVNGGVHEKKKWNDSIQFDRYSWFHELTMLYDVLIAEFDPKSPFSNWFSKKQLANISDCSSFKLLMVYTLDSSKVPTRSVLSTLEKHGYRPVSVSNFKESLNLHPDVEKLSLQLYNIYGYCKKLPTKNAPMFVSIPSFPEVLIK